MTAATLGIRPRALTTVEAHAIAAAVRIGMRWCSLKCVASTLAAVPASRRPGSEPVAGCLAAARAAASRVAHPTCLFESLVAFGLLARRGHAVGLHLGARREEVLESHAWITLDGLPCEPDSANRYTEIWRIGPTRRR